MSEREYSLPEVILFLGNSEHKAAKEYCEMVERIAALEKVAEELMIAKTNDPESFEYMDGDDRVLNALRAAGYLPTHIED